MLVRYGKVITVLSYLFRNMLWLARKKRYSPASQKPSLIIGSMSHTIGGSDELCSKQIDSWLTVEIGS